MFARSLENAKMTQFGRLTVHNERLVKALKGIWNVSEVVCLQGLLSLQAQELKLRSLYCAR